MVENGWECYGRYDVEWQRFTYYGSIAVSDACEIAEGE